MTFQEFEQFLLDIGETPGYSNDAELSAALVRAIETMYQRRPDLLLKLYQGLVDQGVVPPLERSH